ncbi:MAG: hypothetical protein AAB316_08650 [Bacteroidota bacterium]|mgnify:CR=1 FL=1
MKDYQIELIDRYFQREMLPEELEGFRRELSADAELREEFNLRRMSAAALRQADVRAFRNQHSPAAAAIEPAPMPKIRRFLPLVLTLAAGVALLLGFLLWRAIQEASQVKMLYAQYDVPGLYPKTDYALVNQGMLHRGIVGSGDFDELKKQGLAAYDAKNWDEAIRLLSEYLSKAQPSEEELPEEINLMNLYVGRAWLEKGDAPKAIAALKTADAGITDR